MCACAWITPHKEGCNSEVAAGKGEVSGGLVGLLVNCVVPYHDLQGPSPACKPHWRDKNTEKLPEVLPQLWLTGLPSPRTGVM